MATNDGKETYNQIAEIMKNVTVESNLGQHCSDYDDIDKGMKRNRVILKLFGMNTVRNTGRITSCHSCTLCSVSALQEYFEKKPATMYIQRKAGGQIEIDWAGTPFYTYTVILEK